LQRTVAGRLLRGREVAMRSVVLSLFLLSMGASAAAQGPTPESARDIIVTGQRTEEAILNFVDQLAITARGTDQVARWDQRICPGVAGLKTRYAQALIDRMAQRAFDVGIDVGEPGCRANVLIVVSMDPDAVAEDLFENHRDALGYHQERGETTLGREALRAFVASDAPVRWWHVGRTHTQSGEPILETNDPSAKFGTAPFIIRFGGASRLNHTYRQDFSGAFIVVDARRMNEIDVDLNAIADYVTMITLAQVDPNAETSAHPTILNLFASGTQPRELTEWDVSYLRGLYAADRDAIGSAQQGDIARTMNRELRQE
jgi:hypothetical protein